MTTYEFLTEDGVVLTRTFSSIGAAIRHFEDENNADTYDEILDPRNPNKVAKRIYSNAGTLFYGDGWTNPAPSGRQSTRGSDPSKAMSSLGPPTNKSFLGQT